MEAELRSDMRTDREALRCGLAERLGLLPGARLTVHSSMKALGWVDGGPEAVIDALLDAAGPSGSLAMPCFSASRAVCDLRSEPCRLGIVPEAFRRRQGVRRSSDPTHSVAVTGASADWIAEGHAAARDLHPDTPLHRLAGLGGQVLHIGCDLRSCSLLHVAEHLADAPYLHLSYRQPCAWFSGVDADGHAFRHPAMPGPGCGSGFLPVQRELERRGLLRRGRIGAAACLLFLASDAIQVAVDLLRATPFALLCASPGCPVCRPRSAYLTAKG